MSSQTVLVLDDEALIALDIADTVEETGRSVVGPALSIAEAEAAIADQTPDIALLDLNVRNQTSWALAQKLVARGCAVIFVTADEKPSTLEPDLQNCVFLRKPVSPREIKRTLDDILAKTT